MIDKLKAKNLYSRVEKEFWPQIEAEIIAKHFEAILPVWTKNNCTLLAAYGRLLTNVSCDEHHNVVCQMPLGRYNLDQPSWLELSREVQASC